MKDIIKIIDKSDKKDIIKIIDKSNVIMKVREIPTFLQIINQKDKIMEQLAIMVKSGIDFKIVENRLKEENFLWFVDYYIEHEISKFTKLDIVCTVNNLILNMIYVLDYLLTYDSKLINRDKLTDLKWNYNINHKFKDEFISPKGRHLVVKDGFIIDRCNNIKPNNNYRKSQILIEYSKSLYKAISYKTFKKLNSIKQLQVNLSSKHYYEDDDMFQEVFRSERIFTTVEDIIRYFCNEYDYIHAGANYYELIDNVQVKYVIECIYELEDEDYNHKCKVDDFLRDFLPDIN